MNITVERVFKTVNVKNETSNVTVNKQKNNIKVYQVGRRGPKGDLGNATWGGITGDINSQTDLSTILNAKADKSTTIGTGSGLTGGGDISDDRTISLSTSSTASLALADTALQPGSNISELNNNVGYITGVDWGDIGGDQGDINVSGFNNDAGYISSAVTSIAGTANQITASASTGDVTLSLPQDIHIGASPTFSGLTLSGLNQDSVVFVGSGGALSQDTTGFKYNLANKQILLGNLTNIPVANPSVNPAIRVGDSGMVLYSNLSNTVILGVYEPFGNVPRSFISQSLTNFNITQRTDNGVIMLQADNRNGTTVNLVSMRADTGTSVIPTIVLNPSGNDIDTVIQGDNDPSLIRADASVDRVGFGIDTPLAKVHVNELTIGNEVFRQSSTASSGSSPARATYQNKVLTTDATVTTLHSFTTASNTTYRITASVAARRTGGSAGTAGDSAGYILTWIVKNISGTVTAVGGGTPTALDTREDQAGWDATMDISGTAVRVRVTGAVDNNISWILDSFEVSPIAT